MVGPLDACPPDSRAQPADRPSGPAQHALPRRLPQSTQRRTHPPDQDRGGDHRRSNDPYADEPVAGAALRDLAIKPESPTPLWPRRARADRQLEADRADLRTTRSKPPRLDAERGAIPRPRLQLPGRRPAAR